jgi:hypothetical protein
VNELETRVRRCKRPHVLFAEAHRVLHHVQADIAPAVEKQRQWIGDAPQAAADLEDVRCRTKGGGTQEFAQHQAAHLQKILLRAADQRRVIRYYHAVRCSQLPAKRVDFHRF